ncbi:MAG: ChbG/HpnK family deacetylase, partial [Rhodothermales bacterium]
MEKHRKQEVPILNHTFHQPGSILMLSKVFALNNGLVDVQRMLQKLVLLLVLLLVFLPVGITFAQVEPPRLIVRGDDMGYAHAGNVALIQSYKEGIMTSVEVLVPAPWFPEAVKMLAENPGLDVGIHLTLSSEWDNIKWRPISDSPSLTDADGYFYPMIYPNENYPARSLSEHDWR